MQEKRLNDELLFDRLVDGELSPAERRELLATLDVRPDGWRRCALAFLEAQSWSDDFGHYLAGSPEGEAVDAKLALAESPAPSRVGDPRARRRVGWFALAAAVMAAFTLGLLFRDRGDQPVSQTGPQIADVVRPPATTDGDKVDDALTLWVRDETGQARSLRVPLVDAQSLDEQLGLQFRTGMPDDVRSQLRDRGFEVQSKRRYAPFWLDNGRPMIVPVEDTKIVPVSRNVY